MTSEESRTVYETYGLRLNKAIETLAEDHNWTLANAHVTKFERNGWCAKSSTDSKLHLNAFDLTQRYMRTPKDSYIVQNQKPVREEIKREPKFNEMMEASGLFHPNALGAAIMADSYLTAMKSLEQ